MGVFTYTPPFKDSLKKYTEGQPPAEWTEKLKAGTRPPARSLERSQ